MAAPVSENHSIRTAQRLLRRLFLALPYGMIVIQILPFQRFRLRRRLKTNGVIVDVHPLVPLSFYLYRLRNYDFVNELVDDFRRRFRQPGHLSGPLNEPL